MAQKEVGYIELEWTCPRCGSRNKGTTKVCTTCGAPQPEDVKFEPPVQAEVIAGEQAAAVKAAVAAGPDIHCPFCNARNVATAEVCVNCGGPLQGGAAREAGQQLGPLQTGPVAPVKCAVCGEMNPGTATTCSKCGSPLAKPAPKAAAAPRPVPAGGGRGALVWIGLGVLLLALIVGGFIWLTSRTDAIQATAREARWQRTITVQGLAPVQRTAWSDEIPAGVEVGACQRALRYTSANPEPGAVEVCGTPYTVDTGTGFGRVVQDCEYQVYDEQCSYTTLAWRMLPPITLNGSGFSPQWPSFAESSERRLAGREERYQCVVEAGGQTYSFDLSPGEYALCQPGTEWLLEVNTFGTVTKAEPQ